MFTALGQKYPDCGAAFLGRAKCLDHLSEEQRSNHLLKDALEAYKRYLVLSDATTTIDDREYRQTAERCIDRMRFIGYHNQAIEVHQQLIKRFDNVAELRNQLAVTYLMLNRLTDAKMVLEEILRRWPNDGFALVHYGFVLKNRDNNHSAAVVYLQRGIDSLAPGTQDGRFFFNLGDAYQRLGRWQDARQIYARGAALQLFPSAYQRSLYNVARLRAQPLWTKEETGYADDLRRLETHWREIRDEALAALHGRAPYLDEVENLRDTGNWQQLELFARGRRHRGNCERAPTTCRLIERFRAAAGCRRGQVKFSVMQAGTHVWPHCGPTNCRLRAHLGLVVPPGTRLRVAEMERTWSEGEILVFDDSFEHEVWHEGSGLRLILIVDVWHPDLNEQQRQSLTPI